MSANVSFNFSGKRALVTGAGRGIGRAIAIALSEAGAETYALSKTKANLDSLVKEHPAIHPVCVDLSNWEETKKEVEKLGQIDLLVNNAAIFINQMLIDIQKETIDKVFPVTFEAALNVSQVVAKTLIKNKKPGSIVNVSTIISKRAAKNAGTYRFAKGALDRLTEQLALELGPYQIRTNSVHPTVVKTDMGDEFLSGQDNQGSIYKALTPLGKFAVPSEMVGPTLFLLSDAASMVNGVFINVDGGLGVV